MKKSWWLSALISAGLGIAPSAIWAGCSEDLPMSAESKSVVEVKATSSMDPKMQLQLIAQEAIKNSSRLGAANLLAEAASFDMKEAYGLSMPLININGSVGPAETKIKNSEDSKGIQSTAGMNFSGVLYDGGRLGSLVRWREELSKSSLSAARSAREQVVYETISIGLERNRYKVQANVYQQQSRKMSCMVELLAEIVKEDKGRASELLQARKTLAQAQVSRDNALALVRQMDVRMNKILGSQTEIGDGIAVPLSAALEKGEVIRHMATHPDILQLRAQVDAAEQFALAVEAKQKPQINWTASSTASSRGEQKSVSLQAGLTVAYSIFNGGADQAAAMAARKRADANRQQLEEFTKTLNHKVSELFEVSGSAQDRAKKYADILKDSDRLRVSTFQQWSQLGRRTLFDVMSAESDHFNMRIAYVNALHDGYQANAQLRALGGGLSDWLELSP